MIREPYNITPYNSTIDTSRINEFGFNFSGDELGSWQAEVAKNNSSPEVLFTSKQYYPADVGYDRIFDGDRVEGTLVPSWIKATNSGKYDGEIKRLYSISDENVPTEGSNAKVFIQKKIGTIETGNVYETIAIGERRIVNNNDSNIIYFAFNTEYIFEESSNGYYISYKVDNTEETEPVIKSFSFVGYLLIANNKNNRINFSLDDAVQIENTVFVPSINTINLGDYLEIYLLNQEGSASPDYFPVDKYVTYYIFTYNGTENDTYSGENIVINDIISGNIESLTAEIEPYQNGEYWGPGMGPNKFNDTLSAWSENSLNSLETHYGSSFGQGSCSWIPATGFTSSHFSFTVNIVMSFGPPISTLTFLFNNLPEFPKLTSGNSYYLKGFGRSPAVDIKYYVGDEESAFPAPFLKNPHLVFKNSAGQFLRLKIDEKCLPYGSYEFVGFGIIINYPTESARPQPNYRIVVTIDTPVIAENINPTEYIPFVKGYEFQPYNSITLKRSTIMEAEEENQDSSEVIKSIIVKPSEGQDVPAFYGGTVKVINSESEVPTFSYYKYISQFDRNNKSSEYNIEDFKKYKWWSSFESYKKDYLPTDGATVILAKISEESINGTFDQASEEGFYTLDTNNTFTSLGTIDIDENSPIEYPAFYNELKTSQSPAKEAITLREAVGEDLIWRLKMWEPNTPTTPNSAAITNFMKKGRFLQDASDRIEEKTYEGEVNLTILENTDLKSSVSDFVQIGNDLFIESTNDKDTLIVTIQPTILYTNLAEDMRTFTDGLDENCILEVDNYIFKIVTATLSEDSSYITLELKAEAEFPSNLVVKNFYDYTIEFPTVVDGDPIASIINGNIIKYIYLPKESSVGDVPKFIIKVNNAADNLIKKVHYWVYSDGTPRAFYTLENPIKGQIRGRDYRLYSNFYNSNWYFFQSRSTPEIEINYYTESSYNGSFPVIGYPHRSIRLNATYSQAENVGIKYHTWQIDKIDGDEVTTVFQSNEIYNSNFKCTFDSLEEKASYIITFTTVNYDGVVASISGNLTTDFEIDEVDQAGCVATVNNNAHIAEVTWMNGLASEPEEGKGNSEDFGNHIGVGPEEQDVTIDDGEQLTYSTIAGAPINIDSENLSFQAGFVINDDAKVNGKNEEFYNSTFLKIIGKDASSSSLTFDKLGLDVDIKEDNPTIEWKLLDDISGQVDSDTHLNANFFLGKNYIWNEVEGTEIVEEEEIEIKENWDDELIWTETESDTNCYYYQIVGGYTQEVEETENEEIEVEETSKIFELKVQRIPFMHLILSEGYPYSVSENTHTLTIPYNPLFDVEKISSSPSLYPLWVKLYDGIDGTEKSIHQVSNIIFDSENSPKTKMILTLKPSASNNQWPASTVTEVAVYGLSEQIGSPVRISLPEKITSFILGPRTNFFYFTVYDGSKGTLPVNITPPAFGEKPDWNDSETIVLNAKFNGTNISSKQAEITSSVDTYKIYRIKYRRVSNIEIEDEIIYRRLIGEFSLTQEELTSVPKFRFIDWAIENKGIFGYEIVPSSSENGITEATIKCNNKIITDWYGWSFTEIAKFRDTWHYEPVERWLFKLNVETNGYSHQTNKIFHQGFNRYPKASIGMTNYITTNVSCLIGDIRKELQKITYYAKQQGYTRDTIESIQAWEDFSNTSNMILVKDYKGRAFIGVIDGNTMSFQDVVVDILTNLSFNITQIDDAANYQIFSIEEG